MSRASKEFERLVARIERCMQSQGGVVTAPDRIPDVDTGQLREVDASVRTFAGTIPILCVLECRQHKDRQSAKWIEELYGRTRSLAADKIVAVTDRSMSGPAIKKARKWNIEVRKVTTKDPAELLSWFGVSTLSITRSDMDFEAAYVHWIPPVDATDAEREAIKAYVSTFGLYKPFIRDQLSGRLLSIADVWTHGDKRMARDLLQDTKSDRATLPMVAYPGNSLHIDFPGGSVLLQRIDYSITLRRTPIPLDPSLGADYDDELRHLAKVVEYDLGFIKPGEKLTMARDSGTGNIHVMSTDGISIDSPKLLAIRDKRVQLMNDQVPAAARDQNPVSDRAPTKAGFADGTISIIGDILEPIDAGWEALE